MRLFLALVPPPEAVAPLRAVRADVPGVSWIPEERWHVTLRFYGEVDRLPRPDRRIARMAPVRLALRGGGRFGPVLWAGVDGDLATWDIRPHVTVARVRRRGTDVTAVLDALAAVRGPAWTADEVVLLRSHLGPHPVYEPVARWSLRNG